MYSADLAAREPSLRQLALASIAHGLAHGLAHGRGMAVTLPDHPEAWRRPAACFVTLTLDARLRGCVGSREAIRPLVVDVAENAYRAAFSDPRFSPVTPEELPRLVAGVSVLSPPEPLTAASETHLIARLRPGIDGLTLFEGERCATLLPAVWSELPDPAQFLAALRQKAELPKDHWSATLRFERYTTTDVP